MELNGIFKIATIFLFCFIFLLSCETAFAEDTDKPEQKIDVGKAFEQALNNYELQKQKQTETLTRRLHANLDQAIETWLNNSKTDKENKLDTRLDQRWEKLSQSFHIPSIHYEYILKGYKYTIVKNDISQSDSLSAPYKAHVIIKEELYVERYHTPDISNRNPYFYTVTTNFNLNYEYKQDRFNLVNSEAKVTNIENDCPDEIKKIVHLI